ncbi:UNKNOWN [Stylonychia lemnae]|uniref:Amidase domain-containing protein n=1 Tax=Stylonychia lemnae TaxID=5949 RepID=A0A077ZWA0_STYLE|nr:UNKNOWN [Stylonychia lemnae]|eukprot:CDW72721.1 UNKNOWN [Stylonychia lemnae]
MSSQCLFQRHSVKKLVQSFKENPSKYSEFVDETLERMKLSEHLNIFSYQTKDQIKKSVAEVTKLYRNGEQRPLEGIIIGLKDNISAAGYPCYGGSKAFKSNIAKYDCNLWSKLKIHGAINGGGLIMHELAYGVSTLNAHFGKVRNPYDSERSVGGSSGGSGAVVGSGVLPISLGTDTGGSIRIPATWNGVVGYRPTIGRWFPNYGIKMTNTLDTIGPIATCMDDILLVDQLVTGQEHEQIQNSQSLRIGIANPENFDNLDPEVKTRVDQAIDKLKAKDGIEFVQTDDQVNFPTVFLTSTLLKIINLEMPNIIKQYIEQNNLNITLQDIGDNIESLDVKDLFIDFAIKNPKPHSELVRLINGSRQAVLKEVHSYFKRNRLDAIIYPSVKCLPFRFDDYNPQDHSVSHNGSRMNQLDITFQNSVLGSIVNGPCVTLPIQTVKGNLPVGLEIQSLTGDDKKLLAIAKYIEDVLI